MKFLVVAPAGKRADSGYLPRSIQQRLKQYAREITHARDWLSALGYVAVDQYSAIWADWNLLAEFFPRFYRRLSRLNQHAPLIIFTGNETIDCRLCHHNELVFAIVKSQDTSEILPDLFQRLELYHQLREYIPSEVKDYVRPNGFGPFVGNSYPMLEIYRQIARVAATDFTVLILGGSGSGKELVARTIHNISPRKDHPFVSLNCAAIPENLLESELFGYEKGAFTGAHQAKPGKFELADKGTLFLDEIGDMALALQAKLLRVLEDHMVERLGGTRGHQVNIRLLAATNQDLSALVETGKFRSDLHYRMNVIPLQLAPLSNRQDDVLLLSLHILKSLLRNRPESFEKIEWELIETIKSLPMSGNVRELENLLTRIVFHTENSVLGVKILEQILPPAQQKGVEDQIGNSDIQPLWKVEKAAILQALRTFNGNISQVASRLGISRVTLYRKMKKYQIDHQESGTEQGVD
jgi:transcriptional regulator with PAS, ATPase and Fis domain